MENEVRPPATGKLVLGITILLIGVLFTLDNLGVDVPSTIWKLWPVVLIAIGLSNVLRTGPSGKVSGWVLLAVGAMFLLRNFGWLPFRISQLWPVVFVIIGVRMVLAASGRSGAGASPETADSWVNGWVAFGGIERKVTSAAFQGADLGAFCGGFDLDLRGSTPAPEGARIDVFAWWGGGEIKVPPDWQVTMNVLPLFAGYDDKTVRSESLPGTPVKRLVVTGTLVMGGLTVKN